MILQFNEHNEDFLSSLVKVSYEQSFYLQTIGYIPLYRDDKHVYFKNKNNIMKEIEKHEKENDN